MRKNVVSQEAVPPAGNGPASHTNLPASNGEAIHTKPSTAKPAAGKSTTAKSTPKNNSKKNHTDHDDRSNNVPKIEGGSVSLEIGGKK